MDIEKYISSGVLESYVYGFLPSEETAEVQALILTNPEVRAAVAAIEKDKERFISLYAITPPPSVKDRILTMIRNEHPSEEFNSVEKGPSFYFFTNPILQTRNKQWRFIAILSIVIAIVTITTNIFNLHHSNDYQHRYNALLDAYSRIIDEKQAEKQLPVSHQLPESFTGIEIWGTSGSVLFRLSGDNKLLYISAAGLPPLSQGEQYHIWRVKNDRWLSDELLDTEVPIQALNKVKPGDSIIITLQHTHGTTLPKKGIIILEGRIK
ncbi:hypothetical protein [Chitinophaga sp. CB10]|uniref:hypothetical protein n=1 Tax=Chitinophaga sp. CB10 TaxID=1891659 RepID=UPI0025BFD341|nr:hypothetical protein [Chitinophaga sp. CB10]